MLQKSPELKRPCSGKKKKLRSHWIDYRVWRAPEHVHRTTAANVQYLRCSPGLAGWLRWLECRLNAPRLRVGCLVRALTRINQRMHKQVEQQIDVSLSLSLKSIKINKVSKYY